LEWHGEALAREDYEVVRPVRHAGKMANAAAEIQRDLLGNWVSRLLSQLLLCALAPQSVRSQFVGDSAGGVEVGPTGASEAQRQILEQSLDDQSLGDEVQLDVAFVGRKLI
jgi:hypothetical protein